MNQTQDLSNQQSGDAGGLIAQNALSIQNVQQLNNQQGFISANTSLDLHAQQVQNQNGQILKMELHFIMLNFQNSISKSQKMKFYILLIMR